MAGLQKSKLYENYINLYQIIKSAYVVVKDSHDKRKKIKTLHSSHAYAKNNIGRSFSDPE